MLAVVEVGIILVLEEQQDLEEQEPEGQALLTELMQLQLTEVVEAVEPDQERVMVVVEL
jgi:hypothetical protein